MRSVKYLEQVKTKYGLKNDLALAKHLGWTSGRVSQYMSGKRVMDDESCLALALQLEIHPLEIIGNACIDRAEKVGKTSLWESFMAKAAMTAGAVLVASGVNLFLTTGDANAASMRVADPATSVSIDYAKSGRRRRKGDASRKTAICAWFERVFGPTALEPATS